MSDLRYVSSPDLNNLTDNKLEQLYPEKTEVVSLQCENVLEPVANTLGFSAAKAFEGARPGYVFKMDKLGLGYYLDKSYAVAEPDANTLGFIAAKAFEGARPGYVFKMDKLGLGYYLDKYYVVPLE